MVNMRSMSASPRAGATGAPDKASEDLTDEPRKRTGPDIAGMKSEELSGKRHIAGIKPGHSSLKYRYGERNI